MADAGNSAFEMSVTESLRAAEDALGLPATSYAGTAVALSKDSLAKTLVGSYLLRLYYANETQARARLAGFLLRAEDRRSIHALYQKHAQEIDTVLASVVGHDGIPVGSINYETNLDGEELKKIVFTYLEPDEQAAWDQLAPLASLFIGASHSRIVAILNDRQVFNLVRNALAGVKSLEQPG